MEISPRAHQQKMFFLVPFLEVIVDMPGKVLQCQLSIFLQINPQDVLSQFLFLSAVVLIPDHNWLMLETQRQHIHTVKWDNLDVGQVPILGIFHNLLFKVSENMTLWPSFSCLITESLVLDFRPPLSLYIVFLQAHTN